jgi:hypothetical protein
MLLLIGCRATLGLQNPENDVVHLRFWKYQESCSAGCLSAFVHGFEAFWRSSAMQHLVQLSFVSPEKGSFYASLRCAKHFCCIDPDNPCSVPFQLGACFQVVQRACKVIALPYKVASSCADGMHGAGKGARICAESKALGRAPTSFIGFSSYRLFRTRITVRRECASWWLNALLVEIGVTLLFSKSRTPLAFVVRLA